MITPGVATTDFQRFFEQFGWSCRRKHIDPGPIRSWVRRVRRTLAGKTVKRAYGRRPYPLPPRSPLPRDFIRLDPWEMDYVFHLAQRAVLGVLETGRFNGGSMFLMAWANRTAPIYSIDISPQNDALLQKYLDRFSIGCNAVLIVGDSQHGRDERVKPLDLLFVDGDHSYQGCWNDLENWWPLVVPGGHLIVHDCYGGSEVQAATLDFTRAHDVEIVRTPYIHSVHAHNPAGSLAHFIKR